MAGGFASGSVRHPMMGSKWAHGMCFDHQGGDEMAENIAKMRSFWWETSNEATEVTKHFKITCDTAFES